MNNNEIAIINEESIKDKIYIIRGEKVMLDFELAEIYGYSTKRFNEQVKNNREKFEGYIFQLTEYEVLEISRSKKTTPIIQGPGMRGGRTSLPYAFTEQGIYMLMTVLRGPLATEQSRKLINIFKGMKDYIVSSNHLLASSGIIELTKQVDQNTSDIKDIRNQLTVVMDNFIDPSKYKEFTIYEGMKIEAQEVYKTIYRMAKKSIYIVDDYISIRTLKYLKVCSSHIKIIIFSDNKALDKVDKEDISDFIKETNIHLELKKSHHKAHDRYIFLDYGTPNEIIYHPGSSSKDSGTSITSIERLNDIEYLNPIIKKMLENNDEQ